MAAATNDTILEPQEELVRLSLLEHLVVCHKNHLCVFKDKVCILSVSVFVLTNQYKFNVMCVSIDLRA